MKLLQNKPNVDAPDATYAQGSMRDDSGSGDGTNGDTEFMTDYVQTWEKIFAESGLTANGLPDNDSNGYQLYQAFRLLTKPYKVYTALFSQAGTSAPTVTVVGSNEIGTIVWTYSGVGLYTGTLSGAFPAAKTWGIFQGEFFNFGVGGEIIRGSDNAILINTYDTSFVAANGLTTGYFEIRVYD